MEPILIPIICFPALLTGVVAFATAWRRAERRAIRLEQMLTGSLPVLERLERIEQAVEHLAGEVDRALESADFIARALADRGARPQLLRSEQSPVTPH